MQFAEAYQTFTENFCTTNAPRTVGLEFEYPVVFADGSGIKQDVLQHLWASLAADGWTLDADGTNQQTLSAFKDDIAVTTDAGIHTLEIGLPPTQTLQESERLLRGLLGTLVPLLAEHGASLLGYGIQPVTRPSLEHLAPRGRYQFLADEYDSGLAFTQDLHVHGGPDPTGLFKEENNFGIYTLSAALQTHVDVTAEEAIPIVNMLNLLAGLRITLLANSSVWRNTATPYKAVRELFWEWGWPARNNQTGIPQRFHNLEHYLRYILDFGVFLTRRGETYYRMEGAQSFRQFFGNENGGTPAVDTEGNRVHLYPNRSDVHMLCGLAWFDARIQAAFGTVEDRVSCQQPPDAPCAAPALTLGLVANVEEALELSDLHAIDQWRNIRLAACAHGMQAQHPGIDVPALTGRMLDIAQRGLQRRGHGEEIYLEPLYARLAARRCPADDAQDWFVKGGAPLLVERADVGQVLALPI